MKKKHLLRIAAVILILIASSSSMVFADGGPYTRILSREAKVAISCFLSVLSVFLFTRFKGTERKWCMFGMLSSTLGDVFMTDILGLGSISTYPGAAFFIIAHIIYGS